jgi:hypothetical protein
MTASEILKMPLSLIQMTTLNLIQKKTNTMTKSILMMNTMTRSTVMMNMMMILSHFDWHHRCHRRVDCHHHSWNHYGSLFLTFLMLILSCYFVETCRDFLHSLSRFHSDRRCRNLPSGVEFEGSLLLLLLLAAAAVVAKKVATRMTYSHLADHHPKRCIQIVTDHARTNPLHRRQLWQQRYCCSSSMP